MVIYFVEHHHLVLLRSAAKLLPAAFAEALYQHVESLAFVLFVGDGA